LSSSFSVHAGVRHGGVLSLYSIYIDILIARLKSVKVGRMLLDSYYMNVVTLNVTLCFNANIIEVR